MPVGTSDGEQFKSGLELVADRFGRGSDLNPRGNYPSWEKEFPGNFTHTPEDPKYLLDPIGPGRMLDEPTIGSKLDRMEKSLKMDESGSKGAIHPDDFMNAQGIDPGVAFRENNKPVLHDIDRMERTPYTLPHYNPLKQDINDVTIDRSKDVPYEAGPSKDGKTVYLDKSLPKTFTVSGKTFDPAIPAAIHELTEQHVMNELTKRGMTNEKAYEIAHHEFAERAEDDWYRQHGIDVGAVNKEWAKYDKGTEQEKATDKSFPSDLYTKPYPHNEVEGVKHEESGVAKEWPIGKGMGNIRLAMDVTQQKEEELHHKITGEPTAHNPVHLIDPLGGIGGAGPHSGEHIVAPAVKAKTGEVFKGKEDHTEAVSAFRKGGFTSDEMVGPVQGNKEGDLPGGFLTSSGRYVDRYEAFKLAKDSGQFIENDKTQEDVKQFGPQLFSHHVDWSMVPQQSQQQQARGRPPGPGIKFGLDRIENQLRHFVKEGYSGVDIADKLNISPEMVSYYKRQLATLPEPKTPPIATMRDLIEKQGLSYREAAEKLGMSTDQVKSLGNRLGFKSQNVFPMPTEKPFDMETAKKLFNQGTPIREIARQMGVSRGMVRRRFDEKPATAEEIQEQQARQERAERLQEISKRLNKGENYMPEIEDNETK